MPGSNGSGSDDGNDELYGETTPNELPEATLAEHRPYVLALVDASSNLSALNNNLAKAIHEIRTAREPIPRSFREALRDTFRGLTNVGQAGEKAFSK